MTSNGMMEAEESDVKSLSSSAAANQAEELSWLESKVETEKVTAVMITDATPSHQELPKASVARSEVSNSVSATFVTASPCNCNDAAEDLLEEDEYWRQTVSSLQKQCSTLGDMKEPPAFTNETPRWVDSRGTTMWESEDAVDAALQLELFKTELGGLVQAEDIVWKEESDYRKVGVCGVPLCGWKVEKVLDEVKGMWYVRVGMIPHSHHKEGRARRSEKQKQDRHEFREFVGISEDDLTRDRNETSPPWEEESVTSEEEPEEHVRPGAYRIFPHGRSEEPNDGDDFSIQLDAAQPSLEGNQTSIVLVSPLAIQTATFVEANSVGFEPLEPARKTSRRRMWYIILVLMAIATTIGVSVGVTCGTSASTRTGQATDNSDRSFSSWQATVSPSLQPTLPPNMTAVVEDFRQILFNQTLDALTDVSSPQSKAYAWVTSNEQPPLIGLDPILRMTQRFALAVLYYATSTAGGNNGESWIVKEHWLNQSIHECDWFGCSCTKEALLQKLDLYNNGLSGTLPREIGLMGQLEALSLFQNDLKGTIPTEIGLLTNLKQLTLYDNKMTGTIPTELGKLSELNTAFVYYNQLNGSVPDALCGLVSTGLVLTVGCSIPCDCGCTNCG